MEQNDIVIVVKKKHRWENHISFEDRKHIIDLYLQGYAVWNLAKTFHSACSTIEYHLKEAHVYIPGRKPIMRNKPIQHIQVTQTRYLALPNPKPVPLSIIRMWEEEKRTIEMSKRFPKSYKEYIKRDKQRHPNLYAKGFASNINTWSIR